MDIDLLGIFQDDADLARPGHCFPALSSGDLTYHQLGPQTSILDADPGTVLVGTSLFDPDYNFYSSGHPSLALDHSVFYQQKRVVMLPVTERV